MKRSSAIFIAAFIAANCLKGPQPVIQTPGFRMEKVAALPDVLTECSGLEMADSVSFWAVNDGGGLNELYQFGMDGGLMRTLKLSNATNVDWEDLARDKDGNIYIGDFGNNGNDRQDLKIYKITPPVPELPEAATTATTIEFTFADQTAFPPKASGRHYDVEAMFSLNEHLYLLTKDRSKPFAGKTKLYRLPNGPGSYQAVFLSGFFIHEKTGKGQVTAADLSPDGSLLAILTDETLWLLRGFAGTGFFSGKVERNDLPVKLPMESVVFADSCTLYITNEVKSGEPAMLYKIGICP